MECDYKAVMLKYSKQRNLIYETVFNNRTHPTADVVYCELKKKHPSLSMGTVYRNLQQLAENGRILKLHIPGKADRFDGNISPHYHSICLECGDVNDIFMEYLADVDKLVNAKFSVHVKSHTITFNVVCDKCSCQKQDVAV